MAKRILYVSVLCLVLLSISAIALSIQSAKACEEKSVVIWPDDNVQLTFPPGSDVNATATARAAPSDEFIGPLWDIKVVGAFEGQVLVRIYYGGDRPTPTGMSQTDLVLGDVNADGKVNCKDLYIIIKALCSTPSNRRWNPYCDLNNDGKINLADLCIATRHLGQTSEWTPLSNINVDSDQLGPYIEGYTEHFSIFGVH
jgi:hypothetical protein